MGNETEWETTTDLDTSYGYLEGVPVTFKIVVDSYPDEPGHSGVGTKVVHEVVAYLTQVNMAELCLNRDQLIRFIGFQQVETIERDCAQKYYEEVLTG